MVPLVDCSPPYLLFQCFSLDLELTDSLSLGSQLALELLVSASHELVSQIGHPSSYMCVLGT